MVCGAELKYLSAEAPAACAYCRRTLPTQARCENGHFVCDECHTGDGIAAIKSICLNTAETDMVALFEEIRAHPSIPVHGPEHHAAVPGIILATYRNLGGEMTAEKIGTGIDRGARVAGGSCGFMGVCGGAVGVGIGFGLIMGATPVKGPERGRVQTVVREVLGEIAQLEAPRCCQRDCWIALRAAARISGDYLPIRLKADAVLGCRQRERNKQCIKDACPVPFAG
jgi:hypothetical protein